MTGPPTPRGQAAAEATTTPVATSVTSTAPCTSPSPSRSSAHQLGISERQRARGTAPRPRPAAATPSPPPQAAANPRRFAPRGHAHRRKDKAPLRSGFDHGPIGPMRPNRPTGTAVMVFAWSSSPCRRLVCASAKDHDVMILGLIDSISATAKAGESRSFISGSVRPLAGANVCSVLFEGDGVRRCQASTSAPTTLESRLSPALSRRRLPSGATIQACGFSSSASRARSSGGVVAGFATRDVRGSHGAPVVADISMAPRSARREPGRLPHCGKNAGAVVGPVE